MNHQRQGYNECLPTALAMLFDVPKDEFVEACLVGTPFTFWAEVPNAERVPAIDAAVAYFGRPGLIGESRWIDDEDSLLEFEGDLLTGGTGILCIVHDIFPDQGHSVAYADGLIYDSAQAGPMNYSRWVQLVASNGYQPIAYIPAGE